MNPDGLSFRAPPARSVRAWVLAIARLLVGVIAGAVRVVTGRLALLYHVGVIIVSAAIAATLPFTFAFLARRLLASWSAIENEKVFLVAAEIAVALVLVLVLSHARTSWQNRRLSRMARTAGMGHFSSGEGVPSPPGAPRPQEQHAVLPDLLVTGVPGFCTPARPECYL